MKCEQFQEWIANYWDMDSSDFRKRSMDKHLQRCGKCKEEFELWKESTELIRTSIEVNGGDTPIMKKENSSVIANRVMNQIYSTESWRTPIAQRSYRISYPTFRKLAAVSAFFLAVFIISFTYSLVGIFPMDDASQELVGLQPVASYSSSQHLSETDTSNDLTGTVASLSVPMTLVPEPIQSELNFLLVFSLLGIVSVILMMNWFSQIRA